MSVLLQNQPEYGPDTLSISGYASLFGMRDLGGDIVRRGAFAASLLKLAGSPLPMLFGHETVIPIGVWTRAAEDAHGLYVSGELQLGDARADRYARLVRSGAVSGLSIGYRTLRSRPLTSGGRELLELDLWEVSIVAFPMLRAARITLIDDYPPNPSTH
jgi:uncharacterized protein